MPWDAPLKKVVRRNTDFTGANVWLQDKQANIKIIAQRHDTHDEDIAQAITACLNLDGINAMRADLDLGTHKILNLVAGVAATDGVNVTQLNAKANSSALPSAIAWNGTTLTLTATPNLSTPIALLNNIKSGGIIRHKLTALTAGSAVTLNPASANRWSLANNSAMTLTITMPGGIDAELGQNYQVEGQVMFTNGLGAGVVTINAGGVVGSGEIKGVQPTANGAKYLLSYLIQHTTGDIYNKLFIWSA